MAKPSWVTLDKSSGTGGGSVQVTASSNVSSITTSARSGTLTIKTSSGLTKTVRVSQTGNIVRKDNQLTCAIVSNTLGRITSQYAVASTLTIKVAYKFSNEIAITTKDVTMTSGKSSLDVSFTSSSAGGGGTVSNFHIRSLSPMQDNNYSYTY